MKNTHKKINNIADLRDDLIQMYEGLRAGTIERKEAVEVNNTAGKVMASIKLQLENCHMLGIAPEIKFLNCEFRQSKLFSEIDNINLIENSTK